MSFHKFNKDSSLRKLKFKQNKDKYIRVGTLILSIAVIIIGILYFSFAKYETSREFSAYNATVGEFISSDVTIKLYKNGTNDEIKRLRPGVHSYASSSCTNGATLTWDSTTNSPVITNITKPTVCTVYMNDATPVNNCTYNGELVQGAEYTDGTYTYKYMQEGTDTGWQNITEDGWGVKLTNTAATGTISTTICTSINNKPIVSMSYMFYDAQSLNTINVSSFDTSHVVRMNNAFNKTGYKATSFTITGLDDWDVSSVTDMSNMFRDAGYSATTWSIGTLANWDISSVETMEFMFVNSGYNVTGTFRLNLSNWDTSNVRNPDAMFHYTGMNSSNWSIGDLSKWDTSKMETFNCLFALTGTNATNWSVGDLSKWDTSNVTSMSWMFSNTGLKVSKYNLGDLSNWDTSKVTTMAGMFANTAYDSTTFKLTGLSTWDVSNVEDMHNMFARSGRNATTWSIGDLSKWDTSKVTNMRQMFLDAGYSSTTWNSIGTLRVYSNSIYQLLQGVAGAKAIVNFYSNPPAGDPGYGKTFTNAATASGAKITANYSSTTTNIDAIIATKSSNSNVVKGVQLD